MADPAAQLHEAVDAGNALKAALAAGAYPNFYDDTETALHQACERGHLACVETLLTARADPNPEDGGMLKPLHSAAENGHLPCVASLLAAGADPTAEDRLGWTALHFAAFNNYAAIVRLLLEAAPQTALVQEQYGMTPLELALSSSSTCFDAANCLLELGPLPAAGKLLASIEEKRQMLQLYGWNSFDALPLYSLYSPLVARQSLTPAEWERVPGSCPGLGTALPAVLERSTEQAAQLVRRLPPTDRERLRTAALCLARVQHRLHLVLPADIVCQLLLVAAV